MLLVELEIIRYGPRSLEMRGGFGNESSYHLRQTEYKMYTRRPRALIGGKIKQTEFVRIGYSFVCSV